MLKETINDISNKFSNDLEDIEVIVRLDLDDYESHKILSEQFNLDIKYIIGDKFFGYPSLPKFIEECYKLSDSYFFLLYNDDALIINHHNIVSELKKVKDVISISTEVETSQFPIIHYKIIEITGGFHEKVIFIDGHYDAVKKSLPIENQFNFKFDIKHPKNEEFLDSSFYDKKFKELNDYKVQLGFFDGNSYVYRDSRLINEYFTNQ